MKLLIYCILLITLSTSCFPYKEGFYNIELNEVERPEDAKNRYGNPKIVDFQEDGKNKLSYEDGMLQITWSLLDKTKGFAFSLQNKTEHSIIGRFHLKV